MRRCYRCKKLKPMDAFATYRSKKGGKSYDCKPCRNKVYKEWVKANPEKAKRQSDRDRAYRKAYYLRPDVRLRYRYSNIRRTFGLSREAYDEMLKKQGGKCAICRMHETCTRNNFLSVDHCHETKRVRGLLCMRCNRANGLFRDNVKILKAAIKYLSAK